MLYEIINEREMQKIVGGSVAQLATVLAVGAIALITVTVFKLYQSTNGQSSFGSGFEFKWEIEE